MTFREKLADWISGGALSEARGKLLDERGMREVACGMANDWLHAAMEKDKALKEILDMQTPHQAHIGKRMAAVAEKGLRL